MDTRQFRVRARVFAATAGLGALAALGVTTATSHAAAPRLDFTQSGGMNVGQTATTTTPTILPVQISVAPTVKATKPKGF